MKTQDLRTILLAPLVLLALAFAASTASAQNFVYTNNSNETGPNTVSAFSVGTNGALTPVPGSPFTTGGLGFGGGLFAKRGGHDRVPRH